MTDKQLELLKTEISRAERNGWNNVGVDTAKIAALIARLEAAERFVYATEELFMWNRGLELSLTLELAAWRRAAGC